MDVIAQLDVIVPMVNELAANVKADQFDDPTPCTNFTVRDLLTHMVGGASLFAPQLRGDPVAEPPDLTSVPDDERPAVLEAALRELLVAVKSPGAMGRTVQLPFGAVPGDVLARFATVDGLVHAWDIATATGQAFDPPEELAAAVLASAQDLIAPELRDGDVFAAETPVPETAPAVVRLAAFTGRTIPT